MQFYAKFEAGVGFSATTEPTVDFYPVVTTKSPPNFEILVWDAPNSQWIEDASLEATYNSQLAEKAAVDLRMQKQNFGQKFLAKVVELNVAKLNASVLTLSDLTAMDADTTLQAIERHAWRGNLTTLKSLIQNYSGSYYTSADKTALVAYLDASGLV